MATTPISKKKEKFAVYGGQASQSGKTQAGSFPLVSEPTPGMTPRYLSQDEYGWGRDLASVRDWMLERGAAGAGSAPIPMPIIDYNETRDPKTGNYLSQSVSGEFHPALQAIGDRYLNTMNQQYQHDMGVANAVRDRVRAAAQPIPYIEPRMEQALDWQIVYDQNTGQNRVVSFNTYRPIYETRYAPFFDPSINYV